MSKICRFSKFIVPFVQIIVEVILDEGCFGEVVIVGLGSQNLFDFIMDDIFGNFSKPKVSGIQIPIIRPLLLLSGVVVKMRFQIHFPDTLIFRHVLSRIDGFLDIVLILFCGKSVLKCLILGLFWHLIFSVDGVA